MINLFTYLSFTNVAIGQLYQYFIIALLSVIILYSTYLSLKKLPSSIQIKDNFHLIFIGFVTIILNIGLFFVFLYLTKYSFFTTVLWFPVFSFIIHVIDITAQSILASTILIVRVSHKNVLRIVFSLFMAYFFILLLTIVFFLLPTTSKLVYKYLLQTNYLILVCNFVYIITVLGFLGISKLKLLKPATP